MIIFRSIGTSPMRADVLGPATPGPGAYDPDGPPHPDGRRPNANRKCPRLTVLSQCCHFSCRVQFSSRTHRRGAAAGAGNGGRTSATCGALHRRAAGARPRNVPAAQLQFRRRRWRIRRDKPSRSQEPEPEIAAHGLHAGSSGRHSPLAPRTPSCALPQAPDQPWCRFRPSC